MQWHYQEAMAVVLRNLGRSDLFLIFRCNPRREELKQVLKKFLEKTTDYDISNIIFRLFHVKQNASINGIVYNKFGKLLAHLNFKKELYLMLI